MLDELLTTWVPSMLLQLIGETVEDEAIALAAKEDHVQRKRSSILDEGLDGFLKVSLITPLHRFSVSASAYRI